MSESIRTFIAIELTDPVRAEIARIEDTLKGKGGDIRWVRPENLHLTLKFLGDVEPEQIAKVEEGVRVAVQECPPFELVLSGAGAFPNPQRPRVIWVGIREEGEKLRRVYRSIQHQLFRRRFPKEKKRFSPHLTVGRVRSPRGIEPVTEALQSLEVTPLTMAVEEIVVMRSDLYPTGPVYTQQAVAQLSG